MEADWLEVEVRNDERITREALYELVWSEPMLRVAERYRVSSSFMARVCQCMGVPRPPRGHWAKLSHGKPSPKPTLRSAQVMPASLNGFAFSKSWTIP